MKHHNILKLHSEQFQNCTLLVVTIVSPYDFTNWIVLCQT